MFNLKLVLIAIFLIIGCAIAIPPEGEGNELYDPAEENAGLIDEIEEYSMLEEEGREKRAEEAQDVPPTSCVAPDSSAARPTSRPGRPTPAPTTRATPKPTPKPTSRPSSSSTTSSSRPTAAPTTKPSSTTKSSSSTTGSSSSTGLCDVTSTASEPLKVLVPLYVYPGSAWDTVVSAASKVSIIAIINPNSGPASSGPDSTYNTYMTKLKNAGVTMIGYVYTSYGARSISDVKADIDTYASKYPGLNGIFFDECSDSASELSFYTQAYNYVIGKGYKHVILNPGVQPDQGYLQASTSIVIFENAGSSAASANYASWVKCAPDSSSKSGYKYRFSGIAHSTSSSSASGIISTFKSQGIGMVYVTDGAAGCCTYNTLTSYFATEASTVQSLNAS